MCLEKMIRLVICVLVMLVLSCTSFSLSVIASSNHYEEVNIQFQSTGQTVLNGTLLIPNGNSPHPVVILIHGAGWHDREDYRAEAEIFANSGIAAFIYDKRTTDYSADGIGEESRSYALLADDALAAVDVVRSREELDEKHIGLWGLSEGSSVAPLTAVQSDNVAFVIAVSASGVPPAQQTAWELENKFRQQGITSNSFIHSITQTGMRFLVSAGLFAEAAYDHVPPLEQMHQPLLAIWGSNDRTAPPVESFQIMKEALERGGNEHFTLQFIPDANHDLRFSPDGFNNSEKFAPGYAEAMVTWIENIINDEGRGISVIGHIPQQTFTSPTGIVSSSWYDSAWLHLGVMAMLVVIFLSFYGMALIRFFRTNKVKLTWTRLHWYASVIAILGFVSTLGFFGYFGYIMMTNDPGLTIMGSPILWHVLQFLSLITSVFTVLLGVSWIKAKSITKSSEKFRLGLQLIGGMLFIPWALYWHLLHPPV